MNNNQQAQPLMADLTTSTALDTWSGSQIWAKGYILRTIPGDDGDNLIPFEVFFDPISGRILDNTLPEEIREEYQTQSTEEKTPVTPSLGNDDSNWGTWDTDKSDQQESTTIPPSNDNSEPSTPEINWD